jgi:NarL family two-component system response regulator LiaR
MKKTRILLVDDHSVVRMGLASIINLEEDLAVVGEAENGEDAVRLARELKPDVVIMDLMMPGMSGTEATKAVKAAVPQAKVLVLTSFASAGELSDIMAAGALGAVTKTISNSDLVAALRGTANGERYLSPEIKKSLEEVEPLPKLTARQMEVLASITRGLSNDDIALLLGLSKSRVKQHLNEVYEKLGASNRAEAVAIAMRRQLLKL